MESKKVIELEESFAGTHISAACEKAAEAAGKAKKPVHFKFNGTDVIAQPWESPQCLVKRWEADFDAAAKAYRESPECAAAESKRKEDDRKARSASMKEAAATEEEMRDAKVPWPLTEKQLLEYIESLVSRTHSYGTCVYAMSMAAEAAFNYVAGKVGSTGFQASCADLNFLRRTRGIKGPFMVIKGEDALYPQYDLRGKLEKALTEWEPWLREEAQKKLAEDSVAHPDVIRYWKNLAQRPAGQ